VVHDSLGFWLVRGGFVEYIVFFAVVGVILYFALKRPSASQAHVPTRWSRDWKHCPRCGARSEIVGDDCRVCDYPRPRLTTNRAEAMQALRHQLHRFAELGIVDQRTFESLETAIAAHAQEAKAEPPPHVAPRPVPARVPDPVEPPRHEASTPPELMPVSDDEFDSLSTPAPLAQSNASPPADTTSPQPQGKSAAEERIRAAMQRFQAIADEPEPTSEEPERAEPPPQREPLTSLLSGFMEERNIRWGELVGGLLIVGCSIALVISFWAEIAARPVLKFLVFNGVTAALFGAGYYTYTRLRLATTGSGLMIIASLLVPLNFLTIAAFTEGALANDPWTLLGEAVSITLFSWLLLLAASILTPRQPWLLVTCIMATSICSLLTRRFIFPDVEPWILLAVAAGPIAIYVAAAMLELRALRQINPVDEPTIHRVFTLLGLTTFATLTPLSLLIFRTGTLLPTLSVLAPLAALMCLPAIAFGATLWRRIDDPTLTGQRIISTAVGVFGALLLVACVGLAWPDPLRLILVGTFAFGILTAVALLARIALAHVLAGMCGALVALVSYYWFTGAISSATSGTELLVHLVSGTSGVALLPIAATFAGIAGCLLRFTKRRAEVLAYLGLSGLMALISLALVLWHGLGRIGDPYGVTWICLAYSIGALIAAGIVRRRELAWAGSILLLIAIAQGVVYWAPDAQFGLAFDWPAVGLLHGTMVSLLAASLTITRSRWAAFLVPPLLKSGLAVTVLVVPLLMLELGQRTGPADGLPLTVAIHGFWLAGIWLVISILHREPVLFAAFQLVGFVSSALLVQAFVEPTDWFQQSENPWRHPWFWQSLGLVCVSICLGWALLRLALRPFWSRTEGPTTWAHYAQSLLRPRFPTVDKIVVVVNVLLFAVLSISATLPGMARELSPQFLVQMQNGVRTVLLPDDVWIWLSPYTEAADLGSWGLGLGLIATLLLSHGWRPRSGRLVLLLIALAMFAPLAAAHWDTETSVASALTWILSGFLIAGCLALGVPWRQRMPLAIQPWLPSLRPRERQIALGTWIVLLHSPLVLLAAALVSIALSQRGLATIFPDVHRSWFVLFTTIPIGVFALHERFGHRTRFSVPMAYVATAMGFGLMIVLGCLGAVTLHVPLIAGPAPGSFWGRIGPSITALVPLGTVFVLLLIAALRARTSSLALMAGLTLALGTTLLVFGYTPRWNGQVMAVDLVHVVAVNIAVVSVFTALWALVRCVRTRMRQRVGLVGPFHVQVALLFTLLGLLLIPPLWQLRVDQLPPAVALAAGAPLGWLAVSLAIMAVAVRVFRQGRPRHLHAIALTMVSLGGLATLSASVWDRGNGLTYHALLASLVVTAWLILAVGGLLMFRRPSLHQLLRTSATKWATTLGVVTVGLSVVTTGSDPTGPYWAVAAIVATAVLMSGLAIFARARGFLYAAGGLINLAVLVWWLEFTPWHWILYIRPTSAFWLWQTIALALPVPIWMVLDRWIRRNQSLDRQKRILGFHRFASAAALTLLLLIVSASLLADYFGQRFFQVPWLSGLALCATLIATLACLWDPETRWNTARLHLWGLIAAGLFVDSFDLSGRMFLWTVTITAGAYVLLTSYLWSRRAGLHEFAQLLRMPASVRSRELGQRWIVGASVLMIGFVVVMSWTITLTFLEFSYRMSAAQAAMFQILSLAFLSRGRLDQSLRYATLIVGGLASLSLAWTFQTPGLPEPLLHRLVAALAVTAVLCVVYGLGLVKLLGTENPWSQAARRSVPVLMSLLVMGITVVLGLEIMAFAESQPVAIRTPELIVFAVTLVSLAGAALAAAVLSGNDPLELSERERHAYVYVAEGFLALTFVHFRVTTPWLFGETYRQYWPLVVMFIAFLGVGVSTWLARRNQQFIAEPLARTGALLPLLPVLGLWVLPSQVNYTFLLLCVAGLYAVLAIVRGSLVFSLLTVLVCNASLWSLLDGFDVLRFTQHPQVWLIPPALSVLVATYLNRQRLSDQQRTTIQYLALAVIYAASTADLVIQGVAQAPWLPLVLGALSICGILAGILIRTRAFLYLGTSFLLVSISTIIWYAAVDLGQTWVWSVSGIVAGILIIALFALFEKKRDDLARMAEHLRHWDA
jgi:ribosomal protein L40E